jgi:uncharacterized membrane protein YeaQ/YmgE (transglycosylase-associated protein family)
MQHLLFSIVMGLIAGYIASRIVNRQGSGILLDIVLGMIGAVIGGYLSQFLGLGGSMSGGIIWFLFVSVVGAIIVLAAFRAISRMT